MTDLDILQYSLKSMAGIDADDFLLSRPYWHHKTYQKGEFYNRHGSVCKYMGFILDGVFRTYYIDDKTGEEKNVFFFSQHQVVVSFKSFINQAPCDYYTQSMTGSGILYIHIEDLTRLYQQSHKWEHFGRLIAEQAFNISMKRTESFLFQSPEERYLELLDQHPDIFNAIPLYQISSYLGIQGPSLSRIRKRLISK